MSARRKAKKLPAQMGLFQRGRWGGSRPGAGRKKSKPTCVRHRTRPEHPRHQPVHVTLRLIDSLPTLRQVRFKPLRRCIEKAHKDRFRICQISNQGNHLHLIVEADDKSSLSRGVQGLMVRIARMVNGVLGRTGKVFAERYHARPLRTPREVRHALVYVLLNSRKHGDRSTALDPWSTARWFDGLVGRAPEPTVSPVRPPRTWLLATGWRKHGLIRLTERPKT